MGSQLRELVNSAAMLIHSYVNAKEKEIKKELKDNNMLKPKDEAFKENDELADIMNKINQLKKNDQDHTAKDDDDFDDYYDHDGEGDDSDYTEHDEMIFTAGDLELYDSPLEKVDAPIYFKNVMEELQTADSEFYSQVVGHISKSQIEQLQNDYAKNEELLKLEKSEEED